MGGFRLLPPRQLAAVANSHALRRPYYAGSALMSAAKEACRSTCRFSQQTCGMHVGSAQEEVAEERDAADAARAAHSRARLAAYGLGASTALSLIALGFVAARCSRRGA